MIKDIIVIYRKNETILILFDKFKMLFLAS